MVTILLLTACWKLGIDLEPPIVPQECEPIEWFGEPPEKLKQYDCLYANVGFPHVASERLQLVSGEVHYRYPEEQISKFEEDFISLQKWDEAEEPKMALRGYYQGMVIHDHHDGLQCLIHDHQEEKKEEKNRLEIQFHFPEEDGLFVCEPSQIFSAGLGGAAGEFLDPIINSVIGYHEYGYMNSEKHPEARSPLDHKQAGYNSYCRYAERSGLMYPQELYISKQMSQEQANNLLYWLRENTNVVIAGEEREALSIPQKIENWPDFSQYQYSAMLKFTEEEALACQRRSVVKWAKTDAQLYGISSSKTAVNYRAWSCQMGIQQIQTIGFYAKGNLYLYRRYVFPF